MENNTLIIMEWKNLTECMEEYTEYLSEAVKKNMPTYYELRKNIVFNIEINSVTFEITFKAPEYWKYANFGRGPGKFPPPDKIDKWITRRKITPFPTKSGRTPTRSQLVFLISRKIAREGFEGSGFLQKGLADQADYWEERIETAVTADIEKEIMEFLSPLRGETII